MPLVLGRGSKCPWQFFPPAVAAYRTLSRRSHSHWQPVKDLDLKDLRKCGLIETLRIDLALPPRASTGRRPRRNFAMQACHGMFVSHFRCGWGCGGFPFSWGLSLRFLILRWFSSFFSFFWDKGKPLQLHGNMVTGECSRASCGRMTSRYASGLLQEVLVWSGRSSVLSQGKKTLRQQHQRGRGSKTWLDRELGGVFLPCSSSTPLLPWSFASWRAP